jgi:hypothetical protein
MLQAYFDAMKRADGLPSSLYDPEMVVKQTKLFAAHPTVQELHGYVLDDENTSNRHLFITVPPLAGSVFFLSHDGDSRVVFESGADFLRAAREAQSQSLSVSDCHPAMSPVAKDQAALTALIYALLRRACNDVIVSLIPSLDLINLSLLHALASDADFFLGEAVAMEIENRPSSALLPIAMACVGHVHPQVANAGSRALRRIQQLPEKSATN